MSIAACSLHHVVAVMLYSFWILGFLTLTIKFCTSCVMQWEGTTLLFLLQAEVAQDHGGFCESDSPPASASAQAGCIMPGSAEEFMLQPRGMGKFTAGRALPERRCKHQGPCMEMGTTEMCMQHKCACST